MPTYVTLANYTDQGIRNVKESPGRIDAAQALIKELGGEMKQLYLTMGGYDLVLITEMPSDEAVAKLTLKIGSLGNVRTTTLKAFPEPEFRQLISELP